MHLSFSIPERKTQPTKKRGPNHVFRTPIPDAMMSDQREEAVRVVTDSLEINTTCLDMVLPFCMKQMIQQRPLPKYENNTDDIESIIRGLCEKYKVAEPEVEKFIALASGYNDVLILLERPSMDHDYDDDLKTFVEHSPVLQGVDELIKTATRGSRSILDTVVLDVFSFKPSENIYGSTTSE
jgi:hypothetical protein